MKLHYFFGCILAAASLAVWPEIGLAHGGGGGGGGGSGGSHFSGAGARFAGLISLPGRAIVFIGISTTEMGVSSFAWLGRNRRLSKDYEYSVQTSETLIDIAATRLILNRLASA
jgi:hypothetical protein